MIFMCEEKQWLAESFTIKSGCGDNVLLSQPFYQI